MLAHRVIFPGNINICKQEKIIAPRVKLFNDMRIARAILNLAPDLNDDKICVANENLVGVAKPLVFHADLSVRNLEQVSLLIGTPQLVEVGARIFLHPNSFEMLCKEFRKSSLP